MKSKKKKPLLHLQKLKKKIKKNPKINALLVTTPANLNYLTDLNLFSSNEREGIAFIVFNQSYFFVSPLIYEQIKFLSTKNAKIVKYKNQNSLFSSLKIILDEWRSRVNKDKFYLAFEENNIKFAEYNNIKNKLLFYKSTSQSQKVELIPTKNIVESLRMIKSPEEIENIKKAVGLTKKAFIFIKKQLKPGKTEKQIAWQMEKFPPLLSPIIKQEITN